jgi:DNA recombination protein RmuC
LEKQLAIADAELKHIERFRLDLIEKDNQIHLLNRDNASLKSRWESDQQHFTRELQALTQARETLTKEFENVANKIFEAKQQQFTQSSRTTLETSINPLREQLKDFKKQVEDVYSKEAAERNKLVGQITELQKQTQQIGQDAVNLATALKGSSKTQGNWGEVILERLLEESGLQKGREYETQVSLQDEDGKRRNPDVIVRLPENKDLIIDAKVSLVDYELYCNTDNDIDKAKSLKNHLLSIKTHIDGLSRKNYESLEQIRSLDFVFIFIPIESAFMLALEHDQGLFKYAYDKHIILVSPTTLLATLRTVENIWRFDKQNKNAEKIAAMAGMLHDQFALVVESLSEVGQYISKTQNAYENVQKRLHTGRGNLYKRIQSLETLGAKTKKRLPKVDDGEPLLLEDDINEVVDDVDAEESEIS